MTNLLRIFSLCFTLYLTLAANAWAAPTLSITSYKLESQRRISLTVYEYTYRVTVKNTGTDATEVSATLSSVPVGVTVLDGQIAFSSIIVANTAVSSNDTFIIRQDRSKAAFRASDLQWSFQFADPNKGFLSGASNLPAAAAASDFIDENATYTANELSQTPAGETILRTELLIVFSDTATVGDVNRVLTAHGARITAMLAGRGAIFAIKIPDPGSLAALDTKVQQLSSVPGVEQVFKSYMPVSNNLPDKPSFLSDPPSRIDAIAHHLAIRANGAWNAHKLFEKTAAAGRLPEIHIIDGFGNGPPNSLVFNVDTQASEYGTGSPVTHGYDVLSIIGATFQETATTDLVSGISPVKLKVKAIDRKTTGIWRTYIKLIANVRIEGEGHGTHIISNLSFGNSKNGEVNCDFGPPCSGGSICIRVPNCPALSEETRSMNRREGQILMRLLRHDYKNINDDTLEKYFLNFSAAGNNFRINASTLSPFNYAAQPFLPDLDLFGNQRVDVNGQPIVYPGS